MCVEQAFEASTLQTSSAHILLTSTSSSSSDIAVVLCQQPGPGPVLTCYAWEYNILGVTEPIIHDQSRHSNHRPGNDD
jgi:hypothetical protein